MAPLQAPDQPAKVDPVAGVAVSVTAVPLLKAALQVFSQPMPEGTLLTVPDPLPERVTLSTGEAPKAAVTVVLPVSLMVQAVVPAQAPLQPTKFDPGFAVAVRVTVVFALKAELQEWPQLIPLGVLVTLPVPVPDICTVS